MRIEFDKRDIANAQVEILNSIANRILDNAIKESDRQDIYAFGNYERGWEKRVEGQITKVSTVVKNVISDTGEYEGFEISNPVRTSFVAEVGNTAPHAALLEWGHEPYRMPFDPIRDWCMRVKGEDEEIATVSAWKIINYYKMHKFKPHYVLTRAVTNAVNQMEE